MRGYFSARQDLLKALQNFLGSYKSLCKTWSESGGIMILETPWKKYLTKEGNCGHAKFGIYIDGDNGRHHHLVRGSPGGLRAPILQPPRRILGWGGHGETDTYAFQVGLDIADKQSGKYMFTVQFKQNFAINDAGLGDDGTQAHVERFYNDGFAEGVSPSSRRARRASGISGYLLTAIS